MAVSAASWIAFAALTYLVMTTDYLPGDLGLTRWVQSISWEPLASVFPLISGLSGLGQVAFAAGLVILVFFVNRAAAPFALVAVAGDLLFWLLNLVLHKPRPAEGLIRVTEHPGSYAYPSGHAVFAVTAVVVLMFCVVLPRTGRAWAIVGGIVGLLVISAVGIERIDVGVHYPSDLLGGFVGAVAWLSLALAIRPIGDPALREAFRRTAEDTP